MAAVGPTTAILGQLPVGTDQTPVTDSDSEQHAPT